MMPTFPHSHLVLSHSELAFGFMKGVLDPVALPLHPRIPFPFAARWEVTQAVFVATIGILSDDEDPFANPVPTRFPTPDFFHPKPPPKLTFVALAVAEAAMTFGKVLSTVIFDFEIVRGVFWMKTREFAGTSCKLPRCQDSSKLKP